MANLPFTRSGKLTHLFMARRKTLSVLQCANVSSRELNREEGKKCEIQAIDVGIELHTLDAASWKSTLKGNGQPSSRSFANQEIYEQSHDYELSASSFYWDVFRVWVKLLESLQGWGVSVECFYFFSFSINKRASINGPSAKEKRKIMTFTEIVLAT